MIVTLDFESANTDVSLLEVGSAVYWAHPKTEVLCLCALTDVGSVSWIPGRNDAYALPWLTTWAHDPTVIFEAHNAQFEMYGWERLVRDYRLPPVPLSRWDCTMARCYYRGIAGGLDPAAKMLRLEVEKDMEGSKLTIGLSSPISKKAWMEKYPGGMTKKAWAAQYQPVFDRSPAILDRVARYCLQDDVVEQAVGRRVGPLSPYERRVWELDQTINRRGVRVDRAYIGACQKIVAQASKVLEAEFGELTGGLRSTQREKLLVWAQQRGYPGDSLNKDTLKQYGIVGIEEDDDGTDEEDDNRGPTPMSEALVPEVRQVLGIRAVLGSASIAKLERMLACAGADDRIRYAIQYHAAHTGRWGGRLFQPQNFPRGKIEGGHDPASLVAAIMREDAELVSMLYGEPIAAVASGLRHSLVPSPANLFLAGDFAGIEARVVLALAGQHDKTAMMASGVDVYCDMAKAIYGHEVTKKDTEKRQTGKNSVLGCGFQMGWEKFKARYCADQSDEFAQQIIQAYRKVWAPRVPTLWYALEDAARRAVYAGVEAEAYGIRYRVVGEWLGCFIPDGQIMWYYSPQKCAGKFGGEAWSYLAYANGKFKRVQAYGGLLTENVVQKIARGMLCEAMFRLEANGFPLVLTVHDECLADVETSRADLKAYEQIMAEPSDYARQIGVPIAVEGWVGERYKK